jgi:prepilin-type N-terminal cleavage/methylation domain-containing protein
MKQQRIHERGFTMVELLIAMAVFSFMMMIVTAGFVQVVKIHQSGIASRTTQQNSRLVLDAVSKDIRLAATAATANPGQKNWLCLARGSLTQEYAVDTNGDLQVGTIPSQAPGVCPPPNFSDTARGWRRLNDPSVEVTQFAAATTAGVQTGLGTAMVTITMASRNNLDALDTSRTRCLPGPGAQFCAVTTLSTTAQLRGGDGQ